MKPTQNNMVLIESICKFYIHIIKKYLHFFPLGLRQTLQIKPIMKMSFWRLEDIKRSLESIELLYKTR